MGKALYMVPMWKRSAPILLGRWSWKLAPAQLQHRSLTWFDNSSFSSSSSSLGTKEDIKQPSEDTNTTQQQKQQRKVAGRMEMTQILGPEDSFTWKDHFKKFAPLVFLLLGGWLLINTLTDVDGPPVFEQDFEPDEGVVQMSEEELKEYYKKIYFDSKWDKRDPLHETNSGDHAGSTTLNGGNEKGRH